MRNGEKSVQKSYKCSECRDTGWILKPSENSAPIAVSCRCREEEKIRSQWIRSGLNPDQDIYTFTSYRVWNESSRIAKETAFAYYRDFGKVKGERRNSILFSGQPGIGKSHLAIALGLNFLKKNMNVVYMPYRDCISRIKRKILDDEYYQREISKFQCADILLIDDLFKGKITEADINIVFEILNHRYLNFLPLIVSTECTVDKLLEIDEAIGSRIYEMSKDYLVEIRRSSGNNYRMN